MKILRKLIIFAKGKINIAIKIMAKKETKEEVEIAKLLDGLLKIVKEN
jgi:hypothetical protein